MILTVSLNPSVTMGYRIDGVGWEGVHHVDPELVAGGQGIDAARALSQLEIDVLATGLAGGRNGVLLEHLLDSEGIVHDFMRIADETQVRTVISGDGREVVLEQSGPVVTSEEVEAFLGEYAGMLQQADCVVITDELPRGVDVDVLVRMIGLAGDASVPVALKASGDALDAVLAAGCRPTVLQLGEVGDGGRESADLSADGGRFDGIPWVVWAADVSDVRALHEGAVWQVSLPSFPSVDPAGSDDAALAGFARVIALGADGDRMLRYGCTCGALAAMDPLPGHLALGKWWDIYSVIQIEKR